MENNEILELSKFIWNAKIIQNNGYYDVTVYYKYDYDGLVKTSKIEYKSNNLERLKGQIKAFFNDNDMKFVECKNGI